MTDRLTRNPTLTNLQARLGSLASGQHKVAVFILANPSATLDASIDQLAKKAGVGIATVSRLCTQVGYTGFHDMKLALAVELAIERSESRASLPVPATSADDSPTLADRIAGAALRVIQRTLRGLHPDVVEPVVSALLRADDVLMFGVGTSSLAAQHAAFQFNRIGLKCQSASDPAAGALAAAGLRPSGAVIVFSTSGVSRTSVMVARIARERGRVLVALTGAPRSHLARLANYVLPIAALEPSLYRGTTAAALAQLCVVELLHGTLALRLGARARESIESTGVAMARMNDLPQRRARPATRER